MSWLAKLADGTAAAEMPYSETPPEFTESGRRVLQSCFQQWSVSRCMQSPDHAELRRLVSARFGKNVVFCLRSPRELLLAVALLKNHAELGAILRGEAASLANILMEQLGGDASKLHEVSLAFKNSRYLFDPLNLHHDANFKPNRFHGGLLKEVHQLNSGHSGIRQGFPSLEIAVPLQAELQEGLRGQAHKLVQSPTTNKREVALLVAAVKETQPLIDWSVLNLYVTVDAARHIMFCGLQQPFPGLELAMSTGAQLHYDAVSFVSDKPVLLHVDSIGRLHSESGPAIEFSDGWKVYALNGVRIPQWVISDPSRLTVARINSERNVEMRRILMQKYGWSKYLYNSGAELIDDDVDQYGRPLRLYRLPVAGDEDLVMVEVTNSTPHLGPDGTHEFSRYTLRVPPTMTSAREAVAWTFGMRPLNYGPLVET
jgi:hypothetical protein